MIQIKKVKLHVLFGGIVLFLAGLCLCSCGNAPKPYDEVVELTLADGHTARINFFIEDKNVNVNLFLYKSGKQFIRSRYINMVPYRGLDDDYTFLLVQNLLSDDLTKEERQFYQEYRAVPMDVHFVKKEGGYRIRIHDSNCPVMNMNFAAFVSTKAENSGDEIPTWAWYVGGAFLILVILGLFLGKNDGNTYAPDPNYIPPSPTQVKEETIFFSSDEAAAMLCLALTSFRLDDEETNEKKALIQKEMTRLGIGKDPELEDILQSRINARDPEQQVRILRDMTEKKKRYVLGFFAELLLSNYDLSPMEKKVMAEWSRRLRITDSTYGQLMEFHAKHPGSILKFLK